MKILQMDLLAFGPFTDVSLFLHEGQHGLHVVYGPNEAGKSSSLRALTQWLYGIPHSSSDTFVHGNRDLRIGGVIQGPNGTQLKCIRRKGRSKTLRGPDDREPLDDALLAGMLGGVDETIFRQRFGIDYGELRRGGEAVVSGGGDLGEILFAAGAGIADVHQIQADIDKEMEALFTPRGSNPRINDSLRKLKQSRDAIKAAQLPPSEWVKHDRSLRKAEKRLQNLDGQLRDMRSTKSRLERIDQALPLIARRRRLQEELAGITDAPVLPEGFSSDRSKAVTELANAENAEREASKAIKRLKQAMLELDIPPGLLEHRTAITALQKESGGIQKAARDRPGLRLRLNEVERQARQILQDLGREPQLEQAGSMRLSRPQRHRIQSLAQDCKARLDRQHATEQAVRKLRNDIETAESQRAALPPRQDADELQRAIRRAEKQGDLDQRLSHARAELHGLEVQADIDLDRIPLWEGTLEGLERLPVPALETIERFENDLSDADSTLARYDERIEELSGKIRKCNQNLERLRLEHDVPTEEDLTQSRQRRNEGWQLVLRNWNGALPPDDPAVVEFVTEFAPGEDLSAAFPSSLEAADAVVDRLRREADRVAEKARLTVDRQDLDRELEQQQRRRASARVRLDRLHSEWREQWSPLNIAPHPPREMRVWLTQQRHLAETAQTLRKQRESVDAIAGLIRTLREDLNRCLEQLGQPLHEEDGSLASILEHCEAVCGEIDSSNGQRLECERRLNELQAEWPEKQEQADHAEHDLKQWRNDWAEAVEALGLGRDASPSEATSVIESVDELFSLLRESDELRSRIEGIDRDAEEFQQSVTRLIEQIDRNLLELPSDQALSDLYDRVQKASTDQTQRDGLEEQLKQKTGDRDAAQSRAEQWRTRIDALCQQAGCDAADDLPAIEQRSARRAELEKDLRSVNDRLDELATGGGSLETLLAEAEEFDPDQLQADLQQLDKELAALDTERIEVAQTVREHQVELKRMDGSGRAAEAQEQAEHLLAGIRNDAEQYIRLRLASVLLHRAIDRYREASQGPVLSRASDLFADLTLDSFHGLRADYDEKGKAVLVGVRPGDQVVGVEEMSDGTCDQLYLALRLALLESWLDAHEPLPFIVDDILIMFDDDRAVAALKALARLSEKTQVIVFTHHEHLVQLAFEHLEDDVVFIHSLGHQTAVRKRRSRIA